MAIHVGMHTLLIKITYYVTGHAGRWMRHSRFSISGGHAERLLPTVAPDSSTTLRERLISPSAYARPAGTHDTEQPVQGVKAVTRHCRAATLQPK